MTATSTNPPIPVAAPRKKRRGLMIAGPLVLLVAAGGYWLMGGRYEETENAYLHQARISVASSVAGRIEKVLVTDNQTVKEGDVLFQVDTVPFRLAQAQAEAAVSAARISVEQLKLAYTTAQVQLQLANDEADYQTGERVRQVLGPAPQDIEWATDAEGRVVLLQARPLVLHGPGERR